MTQVKLKAAVTKINQEKEVEKKKCKWKDCKKTHNKNITYPDDGKLSRSSNFSTTWVKAGLEPWVKRGDGKNKSNATLKDYRKETEKAAYAVTAANMIFPEYHTQKHHLVSINLFKNTSKLKHNAKLVGYDVNHVKNGICLPTYTLEIVRHDLQAHRGSHPNNLYNSKIQPLLKKIEKDTIKLCKSDTEGELSIQKTVIGKLDRLSVKTEKRIMAWDWLLRTDAIAERNESYARINKKPPRLRGK